MADPLILGDEVQNVRAFASEIRLAPSGHIIGIDMDAALRIGAARGCDLAVLSELPSAAEAGLIEALATD